MTCLRDCGRLFRSNCLPLSLDFLTSQFTVLMSTVSSSYKVNNHQWILMGVPFLCIKNSITARCLMCFNIVGTKYKANHYVQQAIPHGKHWNKFCLKVTLHALDTVAEALLSEHCSYFLIHISFTESCSFTVCLCVCVCIYIYIYIYIVKLKDSIETHTKSHMIHVHPCLFNLWNFEINLHHIRYFYFWFHQTNITLTLYKVETDSLLPKNWLVGK